MSEATTREPRPLFRGPLLVCICVIYLVIAVLLAVVGPLFMHPPGDDSRRLTCMKNLKQLGMSLWQYADNHERRYPLPEQRCDLLVGGDDIDAGVFRCPATKVGPCNYAMNPNADPDSAGDVVLLFESEPGWNQFGGPELLATENHRGRGCSILFVDGSVRFVKAEELDELKWGDGSSAEGGPAYDEENP
ncbi:hypothetical protein [Anaerobaca lacustris]|uniref:DUF1559 domain-containing protein n=1 Tax=Anaerobaca lacustris TaxID=3044600 RepID=A0AAW6U5F8_9BACT|nr:hypothetical protein [Sedimentisphaerales bacterium M17dextr]